MEEMGNGDWSAAGKDRNQLGQRIVIFNYDVQKNSTYICLRFFFIIHKKVKADIILEIVFRQLSFFGSSLAHLVANSHLEPDLELFRSS